MSSNIQVQRICQHCGVEFVAKTTHTRFCSHTCNSRAYKAQLRQQKVEVSNSETRKVKNKPMEDLKAKEFLTVQDVAKLLNLSTRTTYRMIEHGNIKAVNLLKRKTLVRRSDIETLFA